MNKELFKEIENIINSNKNYKEHYHLCTYFEVEHIDILLKEYKKSKSENTNLKQAINEIREYVLKEKEFNDKQIAEYKTCIKTNENGKFNDKEKENFEHCMTVNICINYKMKDILQIIDKVLGGSDERGNTKLKS